MNRHEASLLPPRADCPCCRVEGALTEDLRAQEAWLCQLCGCFLSPTGDIQAGQRFTQPAEVEAALQRWAQAEGEADWTRFVATHFLVPSPEALVIRLLAGEPVETSFDVMGWMFRRAAGARVQTQQRRPITEVEPLPPPPPPDPLAVGCALATVMLADGRVDPREHLFYVQHTDGVALPAPRLWRPPELGLPPDPARALTLLIQMAVIDLQIDASEARVVREFARHWRLPPPTLPEPAPADRLLRNVRSALRRAIGK